MGIGVSLGSDKNVLKLDSGMVIQPCEWTKKKKTTTLNYTLRNKRNSR